MATLLWSCDMNPGHVIPRKLTPPTSDHQRAWWRVSYISWTKSSDFGRKLEMHHRVDAKLVPPDDGGTKLPSTPSLKFNCTFREDENFLSRIITSCLNGNDTETKVKSPLWKQPHTKQISPSYFQCEGDVDRFVFLWLGPARVPKVPQWTRLVSLKSLWDSFRRRTLEMWRSREWCF